MKRVCVAIPHSHTFLWTQTCIAALHRFPPLAEGVEAQIVLVDNSWDWSPSIRGITETRLGEGVTVLNNPKGNKFHASALDAVVELYDFDYLMAFETDVLPLRADWLQWFLDQMTDNVFAVGHWHHEQFINPSCTLYRGCTLREMMFWCRQNAEPLTLRWGSGFNRTAPLDEHCEQTAQERMVEWIAGPFAEKRGWPEGTYLEPEPSGQKKGPGWYEPGQALHHWAIEAGYAYKVCDTATTEKQPGLPTQTFYGKTEPYDRDLEAFEMWNQAYAVHLWGGTRALDIIKHPVECEFTRSNAAFWQAREARFWRQVVPDDVQIATLELIRRHGWHIKGQGTAEVTDRDREAARTVEANYRQGGVEI